MEYFNTRFPGSLCYAICAKKFEKSRKEIVIIIIKKTNNYNNLKLITVNYIIPNNMRHSGAAY